MALPPLPRVRPPGGGGTIVTRAYIVVGYRQPLSSNVPRLGLRRLVQLGSVGTPRSGLFSTVQRSAPYGRKPGGRLRSPQLRGGKATPRRGTAAPASINAPSKGEKVG